MASGRRRGRCHGVTGVTGVTNIPKQTRKERWVKHKFWRLGTGDRERSPAVSAAHSYALMGGGRAQ